MLKPPTGFPEVFSNVFWCVFFVFRVFFGSRQCKEGTSGNVGGFQGGFEGSFVASFGRLGLFWTRTYRSCVICSWWMFVFGAGFIPHQNKGACFFCCGGRVWGHLSLEELVGDTIRVCTDALPKANVASENRPSQKEVSSSNHLFSGAKNVWNC